MMTAQKTRKLKTKLFKNKGLHLKLRGGNGVFINLSSFILCPNTNEKGKQNELF